MAVDADDRVHVERVGMVGMALPAEEAFWLFNADGERRWVAGWDPRFVHPAEPGAGEGVVFQTTRSDAAITTWVQIRHEPANGAASFVSVVPDHHVSIVDVHVTPDAEGRSRACVRYRMTSLSPRADDFVREFGEGYEDFMAQWADAIQRHVVEGVPLPGP